jgi:hypothetical protein
VLQQRALRGRTTRSGLRASLPSRGLTGPWRSVCALGSILSHSIGDCIQKRRLTMSVSIWLSWPFSRSHALRGQRRSLVSRRRKAGLFLEHLEVRTLLSSYTALTVSALIAGINAANTAGGANTITLTAPTTSPYLFTASNNGTNGGNFLPVIAANDTLTIVGNGDTMQPTGKQMSARFFNVTAGASLTLQNLTLKGGSLLSGGLYEGGAIFNQGALTLSGVTVQSNEVKPLFNLRSAMGGGIWSNGSLTLENGTLVQDNTAFGSSGENSFDAFGGAVYIAGGSASISDTTFTGNTAEGGVGAGGPDASGFAGALYVAAGQVVMNTSTVNNNFIYSPGAGYATYGGGMYVAGGAVTLSNDAVQSNSAIFGGGLYVTGGTMTLSNDTVESNSASSAGGGIYVASLATVYIDPFTLAHVINNTAAVDPNIDGTYIET